MTDRRIIFQGELQLLRWSESSANGATVSFWVHPEDLESFKHLKARAGKTAGQRIATVMMEIGADEAVVQQPEPAPTPAPRPRPTHIGSLALIAVQWCKSEVFQKWIEHEWATAAPVDEAEAKKTILHLCGLTAKHGTGASRKHLDADPEAAALFHQRIRIPFSTYLREHALEP